MSIIQKNPALPNDAVTIDQVNPSQLKVAAINYPGGISAPATIDAAPIGGGPLRIYLDSNGTISTDLYQDHYWLLAEAILPDRPYESQPTGQVDPNGQPIMTMVEKSLDLNQVDITVFPLPEVA